MSPEREDGGVSYILLDGTRSAAGYPDKLRPTRFDDPETGKRFVFLTNDFSLPALTIAELYRRRWRGVLFFKWIKQHLRIKAFYGTLPNAVRTQIRIAISVYVLIAIARKRLEVDRDMYAFLQIISVYAFEKGTLSRPLTSTPCNFKDGLSRN